VGYNGVVAMLRTRAQNLCETHGRRAMKRYLRSRLFTALLVVAWGFAALVPHARAQDAASGNAPQAADQKQAAPVRPTGPSLATATLLYRAREYEKAAAEYNAVIAANPTSSNAYAGLARVYAGQSKLTDALAAANKAVEMENDNPNAHIALGEVYFRLGKIPEAEAEFIAIVKSGRAYARAYLGEARISWASSYYRQAKRMIDLAHKLDSADPDITNFWFRTQISSGHVQVEARDKDKEDADKREKEKDGPPEKNEDLSRIVETLSDNQQERRCCRPSSMTVPVELPLEPLMNDPRTFRGMGLKWRLMEPQRSLWWIQEPQEFSWGGRWRRRQG
jgi:tetratricopeptide (TPR) repeat protein